jgi:hypothetical protein
MAMPHRRAQRHGHFRLKPVCAVCGRELNLLFLPVRIAACTRSSFFAVSHNSGLQRMVQIAIFWNLSHSPQFAPRRGKTRRFFWPAFNLFANLKEELAISRGH